MCELTSSAGSISAVTGEPLAPPPEMVFTAFIATRLNKFLFWKRRIGKKKKDNVRESTEEKKKGKEREAE